MALNRTCPKCKSPADAEAHFCGECGSPLPAPAGPADSRHVDQLLDRVSGMPKAKPHTSPAHGVPVHVPPARSGSIAAPTPSPLGRSGPVAISLDRLVG